jgi:SWIM zinc finger
VTLLHSERNTGRIPNLHPDERPDVSRIDTGPLPPMEGWLEAERVNSAILAPRARAGMDPRMYVQTAIERAYRERIDGTLRYHGIKNGLIHYGAPKRHDPTQEYHVTIDFPGQDIFCSCGLRQSGIPCGHVGAAMILLRSIQEAAARHACSSQRQIDIWAAALHG